MKAGEMSGIITVDLMDFAPESKSVTLDICQFLEGGLILREKSFREMVADFDWNQFVGCCVAVICSEDTIIPLWAYMSLSVQLEQVAKTYDFKSAAELDLDLWKERLRQADFTELKGMKVVVRASANIDPSLYMLAASKLKPIVKTLMYGEAGLPKVIWKSPAN